MIGTHGTSLSTIIHYFNPDFRYEDFQEIRDLMPWILRFDFLADNFVGMREYRLYKNIWICGGHDLILQLMEKDLLEEYDISIIPTILGSGIRLFHEQPAEMK